MLQASPLMAIIVRETPTRHTDKPIHPRHQYEKYFQILQSPDAKLPPIVDHVVVSAATTTFITYKTDVVAGVRVLSETPETADCIHVRVHHDTGLEITTTNNSIQHERVLVEVLLPTPNAVRVVDARVHGTLVVEDQVLPINDPYADIRLRAGGDCKLLVTSHADINVKSLYLNPQGAGVIQLQAPSLTLRDMLHANIAGKAGVHLSVDKLKLPGGCVEASGYADVHVAARETEVLAELSLTSVGMGSISVMSDFMRADRLRAYAGGRGKLAVVSAGELTANYVDCTVHGVGEILLQSPAAVCNVSHLVVHGMGVINAASLVAREANVDAHGVSTSDFSASEVARAEAHGLSRTMIHEPLPPSIIGNPSTAPPVVHAPVEVKTTTIVVPLRMDVFALDMEPESQSIFPW